ncbi:nucleoporin Gle1-like [Teleopsis dalmanni]|uniref:nucleoporin Gle1-like n=1 Tax=Teleopsis dalmanni TaxID=139649 RepID=UPI0018CDAA51|nr:nucleoporin Gle1-like [Teleopsis dalmanni]
MNLQRNSYSPVKKLLKNQSTLYQQLIAEGIISINDHPLGPDYCLLLLTKLFVEQGDVLIGSVSQAAFGIASIIVSLWKVLPEFGALFLATLYKESPYLVPYYVTKQTQQSTEDYLKTLGYKFKKGMLENQEQFLKRQTGYARLFSAIMITSGRKIDEQPHPFGKEHCWSWLTNFINMEPFPNVSTTILYEVLKTVSANLYETYGKQFLKLIIFIRHTYIPKVKEINSDGLTVRLEVLLDEYLKTKSFKMPLGFLSKDFW